MRLISSLGAILKRAFLSQKPNDPSKSLRLLREPDEVREAPCLIPQITGQRYRVAALNVAANLTTGKICGVHVGIGQTVTHGL